MVAMLARILIVASSSLKSVGWRPRRGARRASASGSRARRERDESRAVGDRIQAPPRRAPRLDGLTRPTDNPRVAISAGPRGAYRENVIVQAPVVGRRSAALRQEAWLAWSLLTPGLLVMLFLVAYPFFSAVYLSLQDKMVGAPGRFVGLDNYLDLFRDEVFLRTAWNSVVYTVVAVGLKFVLGLTMALILDQPRRFNNVFRTLLFVPWAVPVVIVALNWRWIFDDLSGFLNNFLITFHITSDIISWLADPRLAMGCVIAVVVWAGTPLYSMTFLAGLQAIPKELYEAAELDGASTIQQFFFVTIPRLKTIFLTTVMLSTIWTATNLQFVLILTRGGPASRTEIFPHLAYTTALGARRLGMGAAVSLVFFPVLVVLIVLLTRRMLRPADE
jgi:multiple sugar transport system permease protein